MSRLWPDEWFDGRARVFVAGEDFTCDVELFRRRAHRAAARRGIKIRTRVAGTAMTMQSYSDGDPGEVRG